MRLSKKVVLATVVLPIILSSQAFASGGKDPKNHPHHQECRLGLDRGMMKELNLTDDQKEQFKTLRQANSKAKKEQFRDRQEQRNQDRMAHLDKMNNLLMADKFDPAKATQLAKEMSEKQVERQVEMLSKQHQMLSILTPEQKNKFISLQKEHKNDCRDDRPSHKGKDRF
ncbi:MAG: CpxP family protein [Oceanospirillaceae bacterium]|nr:CpxP family protein [Oceanospirillaceae bacterium]